MEIITAAGDCCSKKIYLDANNKIVKGEPTGLYHGTSRAVNPQNVEELLPVLEAAYASSNTLIVIATCKGRDPHNKPDQVLEVIRDADWKKKYGKKAICNGVVDNTYTRTKDALHGGCWLFIDFDRKNLPPPLAALTLGGMLELWEPIIPRISTAPRIEALSSGSRCRRVGSTIEPAYTHAWIRLDSKHVSTVMALVEEYYAYLGLFVLKDDGTNRGKMVEKSALDYAAMPPKRLVLTSMPRLGKGLERIEAPLRIVNAGEPEIDPLTLTQLVSTAAIPKSTKSILLDANQIIKSLDRGTHTAAEWLSILTLNEKVRCWAPFGDQDGRNDSFLREQDGHLFCFNTATREKYMYFDILGEFKVLDDSPSTNQPLLPRSRLTPINEFVYLPLENKYYDPNKRHSYSKQTFNAIHQETPPPNEKGTKKPADKHYHRCDYGRDVAAIVAYPMKKEFFEEGDNLFYNSYIKHPLAAPTKHFPEVLRETLENYFTICHGKHAAIVREWLAWVIRNPGRQLGWSPILVGEQGTGKTLLYDMATVVFGDYAHYATQKELEEQWTSFMKNRFLILGDEFKADGFNSCQMMRKLRQLITGKRFTVIEKHVSSYSLPNVCNFLFATNNRDALPLSDIERRFLVLGDMISAKDALDPLVQDIFAILVEAMESPDFAAQLVSWALSVDISRLKPFGLKQMAYDDESADMRERTDYVGAKVLEALEEVSEGITGALFAYKDGIKAARELLGKTLLSIGAFKDKVKELGYEEYHVRVSFQPPANKLKKDFIWIHKDVPRATITTKKIISDLEKTYSCSNEPLGFELSRKDEGDSTDVLDFFEVVSQ